MLIYQPVYSPGARFRQLEIQGLSLVRKWGAVFVQYFRSLTISAQQPLRLPLHCQDITLLLWVLVLLRQGSCRRS